MRGGMRAGCAVSARSGAPAMSPEGTSRWHDPAPTGMDRCDLHRADGTVQEIPKRHLRAISRSGLNVVFEAVRQALHRRKDLAFVRHLVADLVDRVHHGRVVATAKRAAERRQGTLGELA